MEEIVTVTSEDLGFKALGSKVILPAFIDEKLPLASLKDLQISNELNLFVATCGGESHQVLVGNLQELRDYIVSEDEEATLPTTFTLISDISDDIIAINILPNIEKIIIVTLHGQLIYLDTKDTSSRQAKQINENITILKSLIINDTLYYIELTHFLCSFNLNQDTNQLLLAENVADFDKCITEDELVVLTKEDNRLQFYTLANDTFNIKIEFPHPEDLVSAIADEKECIPLNVTALYNNQYLLVFGNCPSADDEDIMYDHKTYIMKLDSSNNPTYHESFDIAPAFGSVKRLPSIYNITLPNIVDGVTNYNIITSSCSTEISIWDSDEVVQPDQDGERAVLPVSQETDNDTCPIGMALDYSTVGVIPEPCSGVDKINKLLLIYVLNNEGLLQIWGFYHSHAIKANAFHIDKVAKFYSNGVSTAISSQQPADEVNTIASVQSNQSSIFTTNADQATIPTNNETVPVKETTQTEDSVSSTLGGLSFGSSNDNGEAKPAFSFGSSGFAASTDSPFKIPDNKTSSSPAVGQSAFGSTGFGKTTNSTTPASGSAAFGKPAFGQETSTSTATPFGQSDENKTLTGFGQPAFGQSSFEQTKSATITPAFGQSAFGKPAFGQSTFVQNTDSTTSAEPAKPSFGQATFGQTSFGRNTETSETSSFGKPSFSQSSFGKDNSTSSFGKPSFGQSSFGTNKEFSPEKPLSAKPAFGQGATFSSFGTLSTGQSLFDSLKKSESPFANLEKGESPFANLEKGESPFKNLGKDLGNTVDEELDFRQDNEKPIEEEARNDEDVSDSEIEDEEEETNESLSDSTVEQTPFITSDNTTGNNFSISSFTDSLKKTANISTSNLANISSSNFANTTFGNINNNEKSTSPFASFANNLNKSETPSFSLSSLNIDKEAACEEEEVGEEGVLSKEERERSEVKTEEPEVKTEESEVKTEEPEVKTEEPEVKTEEPEKFINSDETGDVRDEDTQKTNVIGPSVEYGEEQSTNIETTPEEDKETERSVSISEVSSTENETQNTDSGDHESSLEELPETESIEEHNENSVEETLDESDSGNNATQTPKPKSVDTSVDATINCIDQKIQTKPVEYKNTGVQAKEFISEASQTDPITYTTFQVQSFENDENYLAELYKPKPLGTYYTNAQISDIPYTSSDKTMRLFESTYQQIEAEFTVLNDNICMIEEFLQNQTTIDLEKRTEKSLGNKYTWRIPEIKHLFNIIQERQTNIDSFSKEISQLDTKISEYKKKDLTNILYEKKKAKEQYSQLDYLRTEVLNNKFAPLSSHQNEMKSLLRDKMCKLDKRSEEVDQCLYISKSLINHLKDPVNTNIKLLLASAQFFDVSNKVKFRPLTFESKDLVTQEQTESLDVVQAGLNINAKKQIGEFFKEVNSKKF